MNLSFCEKKPTLHDLDFKNDNLLKLCNHNIDELPNLLIYGVQEDLISYRRYSNTNYPHYFNSEFRKFLKGKSVVEFSSSDGLLLYKIDIDFLSSHKFELDQCKSTSLK